MPHDDLGFIASSCCGLKSAFNGINHPALDAYRKLRDKILPSQITLFYYNKFSPFSNRILINRPTVQTTIRLLIKGSAPIINLLFYCSRNRDWS